MPTIRDFEKKYRKMMAPLDLELLLSSVIRKPREFVLAHPEYELSKAHEKKLKPLLKRRQQGEPLAYLLGHKDFFGLDFKVDRRVLVPRPETELLVEKATGGLRNLLRNRLRNSCVIDLGTGSGNIILSILAELKKQKSDLRKNNFFGIDISRDALRVARNNSKIHKAEKEIRFVHGNLLEPIMRDSSMFHDPCSIIILANLPYLETGWKKRLKSTETRGLRYEPEKALYSGSDGLDAYRELAHQIRAWKPEKAFIYAEIGPRQSGGLRRIFSFAHSILFHRDLAGKIRLAEIRL